MECGNPNYLVITSQLKTETKENYKQRHKTKGFLRYFFEYFQQDISLQVK